MFNGFLCETNRVIISFKQEAELLLR